MTENIIHLIRVEFTVMLVSENPVKKFREAYENGITRVLLPEFDRMMKCEHENPFHYTNVGRHSLDVVKGVPNRVNLRWAALLHDVGKPDTKAWDENKGRYRYIGHPEKSVEIATDILDRFKFEEKDKEHILNLIRYHDFVCETPSKLRRFAGEMGREFFKDFFPLQYADAYAHTPEYAPFIQEKHDKMKEKIESYFEDGSAIDISGLKIDRDTLNKFGFTAELADTFLNKMLSECLGQPELNNEEFLKNQAAKYILKISRKET